MGIDVYLTNEDFRYGPSTPAVLDPSNELARLLSHLKDESFLCLRFIDPYGNTVFNRLQMDQLLGEVGRIGLTTQSSLQREILTSIKALAEKCKSEPHLYLVFVGD